MSFNKIDQYDDLSTAEEESREVPGRASIVIPVDLKYRLEVLEEIVSELQRHVEKLRFHR